MAAKPIPPRPAPRLYLATPPVIEAAEMLAMLPELISAADVAAVLLRLAPSDERTLISRIKALTPSIQQTGAALLIDGHFELVARSGADGAHLPDYEMLQEALPTLKPDWIAGVGGLYTRHDAMMAGEVGVDYVLFGEPDEKDERPSVEAIEERLQWWSEVFEIPCVGHAMTLDEAGIFTQAGADFVLVGDFIWADSRGPLTALKEAHETLLHHHRRALDAIKLGEGIESR